ncbi:coxsackievirus and adenovirus receptor [Amia ocellicauda]|uniref:coxsackievirus and adenovirus receptor n=1 Tax=Amia ocellicauda TaxID=2972642 RepID=UPI003464A4EC
MYLVLVFLWISEDFAWTSGDGGLLHMEGREGGSVVLPCQYNLTAVQMSPGNLDIEWNVKHEGNSNTVIWYTDGKVYVPALPFRDRISFMNYPNTSGDVKIVSLRLTDSGFYHCKLLKARYIEQKTINMTVLGMQETSESPWPPYGVHFLPLLFLLCLVPLVVWGCRRKCLSNKRNIKSSSAMKENDIYMTIT